MVDTNVLVSAAVLSSPYLSKMLDILSERHTIVLSTYVIDELKRVTRVKFPNQYEAIENFLCELPYELVYTPERINTADYPYIRDAKDLPVLVSAIIEDVDVLLSLDKDFAPLDMKRPEVITPHLFVEKYGI
jgi:predicted nucleic acid-binding protein